MKRDDRKNRKSRKISMKYDDKKKFININNNVLCSMKIEKIIEFEKVSRI